MHRTWFRHTGSVCLHWLPLLFWMALIFWLSDQPSLPHPGRKVGVSDDLGDYAAHAFTFGVLALLAWWALRASWPKLPVLLTSRPAYSAGVFAALYAISDEIHQSFVPGRWAKVPDLIADCIGILIVTGFLVWWQHRIARNRARDKQAQAAIRRASKWPSS